MTTFPDLRSYKHHQDETAGATLTLPIGGREYTWHSGALSMRAGLIITQARSRIRAAMDRMAAAEAEGVPFDDTVVYLSAAEQTEVTDDLIGAEARAQMIADGVLVREYAHVGLTLITWHLSGEDPAREFWASVEARGEGGARPPAEGSGSTRSPAGSSTSPSKPRRSTGTKSLRAGTSSKRTSTTRTTSTSRKPKS